MSEIILTINGVDYAELYGEKNSKLNLIKKAFPELSIISRGENIKILGESKKDTQKAKSKIEQLVKILRKQDTLPIDKVMAVLNGNLAYELEDEGNDKAEKSSNNVIVHGRNGRPIKARTQNQKRLVNLSEDNDIVFEVV